MAEIEVGAQVVAMGHSGRFEVVEIKVQKAKIKLLANKIQAGEPVELSYFLEVPVSTLTPC